MQVAFYFAGEITQVKESIPWVHCASGNVYILCQTMSLIGREEALDICICLRIREVLHIYEHMFCKSIRDFYFDNSCQVSLPDLY